MNYRTKFLLIASIAEIQTYKGSFTYLGPDMWAYPTKIDRLSLLLFEKYRVDNVAFARETLFSKVASCRYAIGLENDDELDWKECVKLANDLYSEIKKLHSKRRQICELILQQVFPTVHKSNGILIFGTGKLTHIMMCIAKFYIKNNAKKIWKNMTPKTWQNYAWWILA